MSESVKTEAATMEEFKQTPYYQGLGIEKLENQLAGLQQDDDQLMSQAEAQYRSAYESEKEAAQQKLEQELQGYRTQMAGTGAAYDQQRRSANKAYEESAVELNNELTKRGLGRSSLVSTQGAYLQNQRNQALSEIDQAETDAINAINERIALLTEQAAQSERTLAGNYARQLQDRVNELKENNRSASISLQLQIAALQQQGYEAYQDWLLANRKQEVDEKEFEAEYGELLNPENVGSSSSSGSSGSKKQTATQTVKKETEQNKATIAEKAGTAVSALTNMTKKLIDSLVSGVKAASAAQKQTSTQGSSGSTAKLTSNRGQSALRQNIQE